VVVLVVVPPLLLVFPFVIVLVIVVGVPLDIVVMVRVVVEDWVLPVVVYEVKAPVTELPKVDSWELVSVTPATRHNWLSVEKIALIQHD